MRTKVKKSGRFAVRKSDANEIGQTETYLSSKNVLYTVID